MKSPQIDSPTLKHAIKIWSEGEDIPLSLEAELFGEGVDVSALREKYLH